MTPVRADTNWPGSLSLSLCQPLCRQGGTEAAVARAGRDWRTAPRPPPSLLTVLGHFSHLYQPPLVLSSFVVAACYTRYNTTSNWYFLLEIKLHNTPLPSLSPGLTHQQSDPLPTNITSAANKYQ